MRVTRRARAAAVISCILGLTAMPASAEGPTVTITDAVRSGATATVSGTAIIPDVIEAQSVGGTNTQFANADVADTAGVDLTDAKIQPLPNNAGLRFIWQLKSLPEQVLPEGVRYTWAFKIGETQYQLQAKSTNMASITTAEDPVGHAKQLAAAKPFFQLRGACVTNYEGSPSAGCYHLAFLDGRFDTANGTVSMDLPYQTRDSIGRLVAEDFKPGAIIEENLTANMSITAAFQAVVGNTYTSDYTNGWTPYVTGKRVDLAVGGPSSDPAGLDYSGTTTMTDDSFTGTVSGLSTRIDTVFARACAGTVCSYAKVTPAVS